MKRLRTLRFRNYVLPLILAALAGRAFMPSNSMLAASDGAAPVIQTTLCSRGQERRDPIEFPGPRHSSQCDHCLSPMGHAPIAFLLKPMKMMAPPPSASTEVEQLTQSPLPSMPAVRAPPRA